MISDHDLYYALTFYAPDLLSLEMDRIYAVNGQDEAPWGGWLFFEVVMGAISLRCIQTESTEEEETNPIPYPG